VTVILLLFIVGSMLLAAEMILPGGVVGILGGISLLAGSALAFMEYGPTVGLFASIGAVGLVGVMLYGELVWLPRSRFGRKMVVESTIDAQSQPAPPAASEVVGRPATALTTLAPSGLVSVDGKQYEAFCRSGLAVRGAALTVIDVDNFRLVVSETKSL
jgi:membrane-bound serine protease (ClpP class)